MEEVTGPIGGWSAVVSLNRRPAMAVADLLHHGDVGLNGCRVCLFGRSWVVFHSSIM